MSIPKILIAILLIFIPLYPKFPLQGVTGTYVAIRVDDIVVFTALVVWTFWQFKKGLPVLKQKMFKIFLVYFAVGAISLLEALVLGNLSSVKIGVLHFLRRIEYASLFFIAYDAALTISLAEVSSLVGLTSLIVFAYGMGQKYFGLPVISTMNEEFSKGILLHLDKWTRISSTFAGHYDLAAWLVMVLAILPALIFASKKVFGRILLVIVGVLDFYLLTLTASRISFIAYLIGVAVTLIFLKSFRWLPVILVLSFFFGFRSPELNTRLVASFRPIILAAREYSGKIASILVKQKPGSPIVLPDGANSQLTKIPTIKPIVGKETGSEKQKILREVRTWPKPEEVEAAAARSSQIRFQVEWPRAINAFFKNPLLGTGYSSIGLATDNDYLRLLGETGALGFLTFALIFVSLLTTFFLVAGESRVLAGFIGIIIGILANAVFIDIFEASKVAFYFWMLMGIGCGMADLKFKIQKSKR